MLVIAAKATILGNRYAANEVKWNLKRPFSPDSAASSVTNKVHQLMYREYMPSIWQSFVTLRILIQASGWCLLCFMMCVCAKIKQCTRNTSDVCKLQTWKLILRWALHAAI
ncbi:DNA repair protein XRCC2 homolog isoform X2 [Hevea brasiliensis]|uniref:DNA repair protein XRCC2 homolog isoform X2 n=1 Tax=Hevea brasiliensis TaxID=3981 RepID=UPI0025CE0795|nr:DNA repair protein XRCC2 homolog isoform X2 [Hevea brasiliensis]